MKNVNYKDIAENIYNACYNDTLATLKECLEENEPLRLLLANGVMSIPQEVEIDGETYYKKLYIHSVKYDWCGSILVGVGFGELEWIEFDFYHYPHLIVKLNEIIKKNQYSNPIWE